MTDPWSSVKDEVLTSVQKSTELHARWTKLYNALGPTSNTDDFEFVTKELTTTLKSIEWDLEDLSETITIVEDAPHRFKIGPDEIASRKEFVSSTKKKAGAIKAEINHPDVKRKLGDVKRSGLLSGGNGAAGRYAKLNDNIKKENDNFIGGQEQAQSMIMKEQDQQLDEVTDTIGILKEMGRTIGDELDEQADLLDDFEGDMDNTQQRLMRTLGKVDRALSISKDGKQSCAICVLIVVLIILIIVYVS